MNLTLILMIAAAVAGLVVLGIIISFFNVWLRAWLSGAYVSIFNLVAMRLRGVPYGVIVEARIRAGKAGIDVDVNDIEAQYLAGGNVIACVQALIAAGADPGEALTALASFQLPDGSLRWQQAESDPNLLATLQGIPALAEKPLPVVTACPADSDASDDCVQLAA